MDDIFFKVASWGMSFNDFKERHPEVTKKMWNDWKEKDDRLKDWPLCESLIYIGGEGADWPLFVVRGVKRRKLLPRACKDGILWSLLSRMTFEFKYHYVPTTLVGAQYMTLKPIKDDTLERDAENIEYTLNALFGRSLKICEEFRGSKSIGYGVQAVKDIEEGARIGYIIPSESGERSIEVPILDHEDNEKKVKIYCDPNSAAAMQYINSNEASPNCKFESDTRNYQKRWWFDVYVVAKRKIKKGEFLSIKYGDKFV